MFFRTLLTAAGLAFACAAPAQEPIHIGSFLSVTGPAAFLGFGGRIRRERRLELEKSEDPPGNWFLPLLST